MFLGQEKKLKLTSFSTVFKSWKLDVMYIYLHSISFSLWEYFLWTQGNLNLNRIILFSGKMEPFWGFCFCAEAHFLIGHNQPPTHNCAGGSNSNRKFILSLYKSKRSLVRLAWPRMEEPFSRPLLGLLKICSMTWGAANRSSNYGGLQKNLIDLL